MSDTKPETGSTPDAAPAPKPRSKRRLLIFAIPVVLLAAAGGAAWKFVPSLRNRAEALAGLQAKTTAVANAHPQFIELPEMAVTLPNAGHPRQMRIHLAVELAAAAPGNASAEVLSPRVYDALLTYLRTLRDGEVDSGLGIDRLRGDLYRRLDLVLGPGVLRDVLITSLVLAANAMSDAANPQTVAPNSAAAADAARRGLGILIADGLKGLDRLPMLGTVNDLLATALTGSLRVLLGPDVEVHVEPPRSLPIQAFQAGIPTGTPTALLRIEPWGGRCLAMLGSTVAAMAIERLLGGRRGQAATAARRSFTSIERAVVERLAREMVARNLATALCDAGGATGVALERLETDASRISIGKPTALAVLLHADLRRGDSLGAIDFLIPNTTLEPMRDRLSQGQDAKDGAADEAWHAHLGAELPATRVRLQAVIEQRRVQAAELLRWQVGSKLVLSRRHDEPIDVFCNDLLVLRGRIAEKDGRIALHIEERRIAEDRSFTGGPLAAAAPAGTTPQDAPPPAPAAAPATAPQSKTA